MQGRIEVDELNLLYVALTRAKRLLVINDALFFLLSSSFINLPIALCEVQGWGGGDRPSEHVPGEDEGGGHVQVWWLVV